MKNNVDIILNEITEILKKQETDILKYIETYMSKEEAVQHSDNIYNLIVRSEPTNAFLKMKLLINEITPEHSN